MKNLDEQKKGLNTEDAKTEEFAKRLAEVLIEQVEEEREESNKK